ncbi:hypothetical protein [Paenibacillus xylanexedens]|uniref:hypothetical protein n=1 Tax=Paenibacillus xylanexedens TaxID=528191 RepID=UPI0011A37A74|nr:hypothetical protein [Paenibacillus xylanexedens]
MVTDRHQWTADMGVALYSTKLLGFALDGWSNGRRVVRRLYPHGSPMKCTSSSGWTGSVPIWTDGSRWV